MFHVKQTPVMEDWQNGGFGLYLHWPFCESKCPYCDFNSHVAASINEKSWQAAFLAEIARAGLTTSGRLLRSVFFGGGTPSLMSPDLVARVLEAIRATWTVANDLEVTLEANPGSIEAGRFAGYAAAGVNRVSIGVQALHDDDLRKLGRLHDSRSAIAAIDLAQRTFQRVSFDLIYARQDQTADAWRAELSRALAFGTGHLSLYQLTIEPGTPFSARFAKGGLKGLPDENLAVDLFEITQDLCAAAGLPAYEVSNHARPGQESAHNSIYWQAGDYLGIGPGAHGRLTLGGQRWSTECPKSPNTWLNAALTGGTTSTSLALAPRDQAVEYVMMGLRMTSGIELERLSLIAGQDIETKRLAPLVDLGLLLPPDDRLRTTTQGRLVLNSLIAQVVTDLGLDGPI